LLNLYKAAAVVVIIQLRRGTGAIRGTLIAAVMM